MWAKFCLYLTKTSDIQTPPSAIAPFMSLLKIIVCFFEKPFKGIRFKVHSDTRRQTVEEIYTPQGVVVVRMYLIYSI